MISTIAINTYRELVRGKVLYIVLFFAVVVVSVGALFGSVTIGDQVVVIKDFGLFSISLFNVAFAVIAGSALLQKELMRKTIFNILAKPVPRWKFLVGKYLGMLMTSFLLLALMSIALQIFLFCFEGRVDTALVWAYLHMALEMMIVCAAAIFFSSLVVTPVLTGLFTFGLFLAGRSVEYLLYFIREGAVSDPLAAVLTILYYLLPHLNRLNMANDVVMGSSLSWNLSYFCWAVLYSLGYSGVLLGFAKLFFERREFN